MFESKAQNTITHKRNNFRNDSWTASSLLLKHIPLYPCWDRRSSIRSYVSQWSSSSVNVISSHIYVGPSVRRTIVRKMVSAYGGINTWIPSTLELLLYERISVARWLVKAEIGKWGRGRGEWFRFSSNRKQGRGRARRRERWNDREEEITSFNVWRWFEQKWTMRRDCCPWSSVRLPS